MTNLSLNLCNLSVGCLIVVYLHPEFLVGVGDDFGSGVADIIVAIEANPADAG